MADGDPRLRQRHRAGDLQGDPPARPAEFAEDISLITFHDADWTSVTTPPITVIDQPVYALGKSVAELLIRRLKGDPRPAERLILPTSIVERGSVGPPANREL